MSTATARYESLDHWRGLACLAVLVTHSVWYRTGSSAELALESIAARWWLGVPIFFVISGSCITATVQSHWRHHRPLSSYFTRRLRRIFPPYWHVLIGTVLAVAILDLAGLPLVDSGEFLRPWWYDARQWLGNLTLTETWRYHLIPGQKALILGHVWTLCYEEQFYVVMGLLLWIARARFFAGALIVTAGVIAVATTAAVRGWHIDGFFFDGAWLQFWFGMVLYWALHRAPRGRGLALALFAAVALATLTQPDLLARREKNDAQAFLAAGVFAAVALLLHPYDTAIAGWRWLSFVRRCGVMCYSLYLVHLPVVKLVHVACVWIGFQPTPIVSLLIAAPIAIQVSWWFHVTVERRFLNAPYRAPSVAAPAAHAATT